MFGPHYWIGNNASTKSAFANPKSPPLPRSYHHNPESSPAPWAAYVMCSATESNPTSLMTSTGMSVCTNFFPKMISQTLEAIDAPINGFILSQLAVKHSPIYIIMSI